jgi:hypothetical protein
MAAAMVAAEAVMVAVVFMVAAFAAVVSAVAALVTVFGARIITIRTSTAVTKNMSPPVMWFGVAS